MMIREAALAEMAALTELALRSKAHWGYDEAFMEACRADLRVTAEHVTKGSVFVAEEAGQLVGFYILLPGEGDRGELDALFLEPKAIGRGYGRQLWHHAVETARRLGWREMELTADPNAVPFYTAMGAVRVGAVESPVQQGRLLPIMRVSLG